MPLRTRASTRWRCSCPFCSDLAPGVPIVPLMMGWQTAETARELGQALATVLQGRRALLVASTDLSHYHDRATAAALDAVVIDCVARFDADGLQAALDARADHACGGGPAVAVMRAARLLGARDALVLALRRLRRRLGRHLVRRRLSGGGLRHVFDVSR